MNKQVWSIAKLNFKNIRIPYFVTGILILSQLLQFGIRAIIALNKGVANPDVEIGVGNYIYLAIILGAVFIPVLNLRKIVNLGGKREGFFWACILNYVILAAVISFINTLWYYAVDMTFINTNHYMGMREFLADPSVWDKHLLVNLFELFGWSSHGVFLGYLQQFAFLLLLAATVHTLAAMQDKWYGWTIDLIIAAFLGIFIPIAPLRAVLLNFLYMIIFNENALMQIVVCLVLAVVMYGLSKPVLARKAI